MKELNSMKLIDKIEVAVVLLVATALSVAIVEALYGCNMPLYIDVNGAKHYGECLWLPWRL